MTYRILYNKEGIVVDQGCGERRLFLNGQCMGRAKASKPNEPISEYMLKICTYVETHKNTRKQAVLHIGAGACLIASRLASANCYSDLVEPSLQMLDVADQFFVAKSSHWFSIDNVKFIFESVLTYNYIILDAYSSGKPVPELYNDVFYKECANHLYKNGVLIVNDTSSGENEIWLRSKLDPLNPVRL